MSKWNIDTSHSEIAFKVKHLVISTVRGTFDNFEGSIVASDDTFNDAVIAFSAQVDSVNTNSKQRDGHIVSPDFFDAAQFPKLSFSSTSVKNINNKELDITGDLTMRGVTKSINFKADFNGIAKGMDGKRVAVFDLSLDINRTDFGINWNAPIETGGLVVSEKVQIEVSIEAKE
jgi:polyisoprenoid-binding protein YceI